MITSKRPRFPTSIAAVLKDTIRAYHIKIENFYFNRLFVLIDLIIIIIELRAQNVFTDNIFDLIFNFLYISSRC